MLSPGFAGGSPICPLCPSCILGGFPPGVCVWLLLLVLHVVVVLVYTKNAPVEITAPTNTPITNNKIGMPGGNPPSMENGQSGQNGQPPEMPNGNNSGNNNSQSNNQSNSN